MPYLFILKPGYIIIGFLAVAVIVRVFKDDRRRMYSADFTSARKVMSRYNKGFVIDGIRRLSRNDSFRNILICGGVGSYKSSSVVQPFLKVADNCVLVVNDISEELLAGSYYELTQKDFEIVVLKFRDPSKSDCYNPLERCHTKGQINKVAKTIVQSALGKSSSDPFWNQQATTLIALCITYLKQNRPKYANLANVYRMLKLMHAESKTIDRMFIDASEELFISWKSFLGFGEKIVSGVVASSAAALQIFEDSDIARVTSIDTLGDFKALRKKKVAIFVQNSVMDLEYLQFITDIFYAQLAESLLDTMPEKDDNDVWLVFDEFASSMQLPQAGSLFATLRKTRTGIMAVTQDGRSQLKMRYGESANTIISNCYTKVYLAGGLDLETANYLEKRAGKFEFTDDKEVRRVRELITADEVLQIQPKTGIVDIGSHALIQVKLTPYFERMGYRKTDPVEVRLQGKVPETVPLLPAKLEPSQRA